MSCVLPWSDTCSPRTRSSLTGNFLFLVFFLLLFSCYFCACCFRRSRVHFFSPGKSQCEATAAQNCPHFLNVTGGSLELRSAATLLGTDVKPPACGSVLFMACVVSFFFFFFHLLNDVQVRARCLEVSLCWSTDAPVGPPPKPRWLHISNVAATCRLNSNMFLAVFFFLFFFHFPRLVLFVEAGTKSCKIKL